jgi:hypothetical protein
MNNLIEKLARLTIESTEMPEGIDGLFLDAVHLRAFLVALDATENEAFLDSFLYQSLVIGNTYATTLKITKLYDRKKSFEVNSLRETWKTISVNDQERKSISDQFHTENQKSIFAPLIDFRNKTLAHNEQFLSITWEPIDTALAFLARVWWLCNEADKESSIMFPFHEFDRLSKCFQTLFTQQEIKSAKNAYDKYIIKINEAMLLQYDL